jgi:hypothetical protein
VRSIDCGIYLSDEGALVLPFAGIAQACDTAMATILTPSFDENKMRGVRELQDAEQPASTRKCMHTTFIMLRCVITRRCDEPIKLGLAATGAKRSLVHTLFHGVRQDRN